MEFAAGRKKNTQAGGSVDLYGNGQRDRFEHMPAFRFFRIEKMQVPAGKVDSGEIRREPESGHKAFCVPMFEFRLGSDDFGKRRIGLQFSGDTAGFHIPEPAPDPDSHREVWSRDQCIKRFLELLPVRLRSQFCRQVRLEAFDRGEWSSLRIGDGIGPAISPYLDEMSPVGEHFAVKPVERADSEIAKLTDFAVGDRSLQCAGQKSSKGANLDDFIRDASGGIFGSYSRMGGTPCKQKD